MPSLVKNELKIGVFKVSMLEVVKIYKYFGGMKAVDDLSFSVAEGELVALIGPNGAGKTTVFNLITSYLRPSSGEILFRGEKITHLRPHRIAALGIGRVFQHSNLLLEDTVVDNIKISHYLQLKAPIWSHLFGLRIAQTDLKRIKESTQNLLEDFELERYKNNLAKDLSHGHRRALSMAISFASKPKLILLDEPFTGMNAEEINKMVKIIEKVRNWGITILLIEHNIKAVRIISDRIVVMNFGKKIAQGLPEDIIKNKDVIISYLGKGDKY